MADPHRYPERYLADPYITTMGVINALSLIIPGIILLLLIRGTKVRPLRNITIILSLFAVFHGAYHVLLMIGQFATAEPVDALTVLLLVSLGIYYNKRLG